jgi:hypothetical protein
MQWRGLFEKKERKSAICKHILMIAMRQATLLFLHGKKRAGYEFQDLTFKFKRT